MRTLLELEAFAPIADNLRSVNNQLSNSETISLGDKALTLEFFFLVFFTKFKFVTFLELTIIKLSQL